jgi:hypothetical protein
VTPHLTPINDARRRAAILVGCLLVVAVAALPSAARASTNVTPAVFEEVSSGVALIKTYSCDGRGIAQGTGFLVGESVVMTARHVLQGACKVSVRVNGDTFAGQRWTNWSGGQASQAAADLATVKLTRAATGAYVFRIRSSNPPLGTNLGMVGYPLGNRLSLNQGKIVWHGLWRQVRGGAPLLEVKMLGAEGARDGGIYIVPVHGGAARRVVPCKRGEPTSSKDLAYCGRVTWSRDGRQLAFSAYHRSRVAPQAGQVDLFIVDSDGHGLKRITDNPGGSFSPDWHP